MSRRGGATLVEVLIVIAIGATLVALLLPAIMLLREAALRTESQNKQRQLIIAVHDFVTNDGRLPSLGGRGAQGPLFVAVLPYLEEGTSPMEQGFVGFCPIFLSPADPTASKARQMRLTVSSYAANAKVFEGGPPLTALTDGMSNTIAFAEHYAADCQGQYYFAFQQEVGLVHRATFADMTDIFPETKGNPPVSGPVGGGNFTFQVAPRVEDCKWAIPQTPHPAGMIVALVDGSVRVLAPGVSPAVFWGAVTPDRGEILEEW